MVKYQFFFRQQDCVGASSAAEDFPSSRLDSSRHFVEVSSPFVLLLRPSRVQVFNPIMNWEELLKLLH